MIVANPPTNRVFSMGFIPEEHFPKGWRGTKLKTYRTKGIIHGEKKNIEIHTVQRKPFDDLHIAETIILLGTDKTPKEITDGLVKRYGSAVKNSTICITIFKVVD